MLNQINIITRDSILAKIQGKAVGTKIYAVFPKLKINYHTSKTVGDLDQTLDIKSGEMRGLFTSDISEHIIKGHYDIAVHSWKDYPIVNNNFTKIVGTLSREDSRDILFIKKESTNKNFIEKLSIMTSSPRRRYGLEKILNRLIPVRFDKLLFKDLRGNIDTRLKKFMSSDDEGIVIAKAAIDRIMQDNEIGTSLKKQIEYCLRSCHWVVLPLSLYPTAPGQGAIAIEARIDNLEIVDIIKKINNEVDFKNVQYERKIISKYGGGCSQKIGVSIWEKNGNLIQSLSGITEKGEILKFYGMIERSKPFKKALTGSLNIFPKIKNERSIYKRIDYNKNDRLNAIDKTIIYLSRKNVLKHNPIFKHSCILWTSGLKTWESAVNKGYWIQGSSESLGEEELKKIETLFSEKYPIIKLTFAGDILDSNKIIDTYKLENPEFPSDFEKRTHFFWTSPRLFKIAIKKFPSIKNKNHSCGMGNTYKTLYKFLGNKVNGFLSYDEWLKEFQN